VAPDPSGLGAEYRFSVPVLRVRDVRATAEWYREHLGFTAGTFPDRAPHDFAILGRDSVQLLVRRSDEPGWRGSVAHSGWDLYIWVDGADFDQLEAAAKRARAIVRPRRTMGAHIVEIEVRDPDGYVICIGGPVRVAVMQA
jgi:catechol 2,3-dioxygenase-like lactoylglutathione lyase family enzyme